MKARTLKGSEAEKFIETWLVSQGYTVHRAAQSVKRIPPCKKYPKGAVRSMSHDLWGCIDLLAVKDDMPLFALQVTTADGMTARRRKVEGVKWPLHMMNVSMAKVEVQPDPARRNHSARYVCVQALICNAPVKWANWYSHRADPSLWRKADQWG